MNEILESEQKGRKITMTDKWVTFYIHPSKHIKLPVIQKKMIEYPLLPLGVSLVVLFTSSSR